MAAERVEGARVVYVELGAWWRKSTRRGHRSVAPRSAASRHWEKAEGRDASKRRELRQSTSNLQRRDMPAETLCDLATNSGSSQGRSQSRGTSIRVCDHARPTSATQRTFWPAPDKLSMCGSPDWYFGRASFTYPLHTRKMNVSNQPGFFFRSFFVIFAQESCGEGRNEVELVSFQGVSGLLSENRAENPEKDADTTCFTLRAYCSSLSMYLR
jgi:hypothetical protein